MLQEDNKASKIEEKTIIDWSGFDKLLELDRNKLKTMENISIEFYNKLTNN